MLRLPCSPAVRRLCLAAATAATAAWVGTVTGQVPARQFRQFGGQAVAVDPLGGASGDGKDTPVGVTVPDSPGAVERLAHAAEKEQQKQWKTAADFYREAVTQFAGRVVPNAIDKAAGTYRYTGVAAAVQERIAKWPPEGLAVYRNLYGPAAADRLAAAGRGDLSTLASIFYDDFVTDAGKAAGVRLIDAYTEAGDFPAAAAIGDRLLDLHPLLGADRPTILVRTALADHWAGDDAAANRRLNDLRLSDPKAVGSVGGKDVVLADALATAIAIPAPRPAPDPTAADTYPSFGGPGGRGDISSSTAKPGASLNTILLTPPDFSGEAGPQQQQKTLVDQDRNSVASGAARGIMPVVDAGTLFFQDGRTVYAVDADSGMPVTPWLATYPGQLGGRYHLSVPGRARGEQLTVTVTPTSVLAVMGQRDRAGLNGMMGNAAVGIRVMGEEMGTPSTTRLVCLDRATGRERWKASPADLPEAAGAARTGEYGGTPLSVPAAVAGTPDDAVLIAVRGGRDGQFDNCYVVCLSAATGKYQWSTYIGSGARSFDGESVASQDPSQLALADGRVLVMTNLGTVAALDPSDGRVQWLDAYARDNVPTEFDLMQARNPVTGSMAGNGGAARPWARNPVVVQGGHVFALPTDAKSLFVLDAATGKQLNRIETAIPTSSDDDAKRSTADTLLGVRDGYVVLTSDREIFGVDWQRYTPRSGTSARWMEQPWGGADELPLAIAGRGFLTADGIYVVNSQNLSEIDWRRHKIVATYPATGTFSGGQGPGNILVTSQNVVVAGSDEVDVYTDLSAVQAKYEVLMRAAPADPEPRVRYATALFAGGQTDQALARMDEAIGLVGGRSSMRPGPGRQMIFNVLLDFAARLTRPTQKEPPTALANGLFDRATDAADGPDQQAACLLARARFAHEVTHDDAAEVTLCQRVLSDPALRKVAVSDDQTAGAAATAAIAAAIGADPASYAAVESRATAALAEARGKGDPDALLAVSDEYPNSRAAADARRSAAGLYETSGRPEMAVDIRRQMYAASGDPVERAAVLEQIAADFLATGPDGVGPATDRLARAGQLSPNPLLASDLKLPDGKVLGGGKATYADAVTALRSILAEADAGRLPDFHLANRPNPSPKVFSPFLPIGPPIPDVTAIVHPADPFARNDRLLAWSPAGLAVFEPGATTPRFRAADVADVPVGAAWVGSRWVVWSQTKVSAVTDDGHPAWPAAVAVANLPALPAVSNNAVAVSDDVPGAVADGDIQAGQQQQAAVIRVVGGGGRLIIRGNQIVPAPVAPAVPAVTLTGGEYVTSAEPAGPTGRVLVVALSTGRLVAVDTAGGTVLWQTRPSDRPPDGLQANGHFTVARLDDAGGSTIVVYDTRTGQVIGRRKFQGEGQPGQLVNVALGEEGTLAITLAAAVEVKDLYESWKDPPKQLTARQNQDVATFAGMTDRNQLLVRAGRVVTLYSHGQYARAYDLSRPMLDTTNPTYPLMTSSPSANGNVWMRLVGPQLFIVQPNNVKRFDLSDPNDVSSGFLSSGEYHVRGLLLGRDFAILPHDPVDRGPVGSTFVTWLAVSRAPVPGRHLESDVFDSRYSSASAAGIKDYVGIDGGLYILTGDNRLHALRGGRDRDKNNG